MATTRPPVAIDFAHGLHPSPRSLRTGDLLFPRGPGHGRLEIAPRAIGSALSQRELGLTLSQYLGPALSALLASGDATALDAIETSARSELLERGDTPARTAEGLGGLDARRIALLLAILRLEFAELFEQWFDMTVDRFLKHPLAKVLLKALGGELGDGFFIGHCALVLRERDGVHTDDPDAEVWVIEANATSFSRYGVTIRPYYLAGDETEPSTRRRSWLGHRAARGDAVWHARHASLDGPDTPQTQAIRATLVPAAKRFLGRSYSFFDSAQFADDARLYCSEFLYRAIEATRAALAPGGQPAAIDDCRRWGWVRDNNPPASPIGQALAAALADTRLRDYVFPPVGHPDHHPLGRNFFILSPQMVWRSAQLRAKTKPGGQEYDAA